ncbi:MAG: methyltransferase domain-containing protein [Chloroflexi bacterium]|nr:methyltransferase domain-containing protein [Chloroflexota bacterium]
MLQERSKLVDQDRPAYTATPACRFCSAALLDTFVDLGMSPPCESYLRADQLDRMEPFYPLHVRVCRECFLVQLEAYLGGEDIFSEYAYFSSYSDSWVEHARRYTELAIARLQLNERSFVVELASNDGYLLQHFVNRGIPALGIEPARNVAAAAEAKGIPTLVEFFGLPSARRLAREQRRADLVIGNNVLAQVPDLNDFVAGIQQLLNWNGTVTLEFPHLARLIDGNQFDTIYHEHYSYFSLYTTERIFARHGLRIYDVEELSTHGGSLRVWGCHESATRRETARLRELRQRELDDGVDTLRYYEHFSERAIRTKHGLLDFLIDARRAGKSVAGYGAPGKGNTLLNYCGIRSDFVAYTVDRNPYKQGLFLPGTHIPIYGPERLGETRPDYILILPWNLKTEIMAQLEYARAWGARFVVPIPQLEVY